MLREINADLEKKKDTTTASDAVILSAYQSSSEPIMRTARNERKTLMWTNIKVVFFRKGWWHVQCDSYPFRCP
jgi:hypothetical protein